jgi:LacI family transcriptional regulator
MVLKIGSEIIMSSKKRLSDIAKELNVSVVTVSNALNDRAGVSDEMRAKIKELASRFRYKNEVLKEKAYKKTNNIAVIVSERQFDDTIFLFGFL